MFFGRDVAIVKGMDALRNMRRKGTTLFVILGPSGAGKSSFLRAGLLPRLRKEDRRFLSARHRPPTACGPDGDVRPGRSPLFHPNEIGAGKARPG